MNVEYTWKYSIIIEIFYIFAYKLNQCFEYEKLYLLSFIHKEN